MYVEKELPGGHRKDWRLRRRDVGAWEGQECCGRRFGIANRNMRFQSRSPKIKERSSARKAYGIEGAGAARVWGEVQAGGWKERGKTWLEAGGRTGRSTAAGGWDLEDGLG